MKQYFEVEIEEITVKNYKVEMLDNITDTLEYIGANLYRLDHDRNPRGETHKIEMLAIYLREDK